VDLDTAQRAFPGRLVYLDADGALVIGSER
jgi:hypothetical protein